MLPVLLSIKIWKFNLGKLKLIFGGRSSINIYAISHHLNYWILELNLNLWFSAVYDIFYIFCRMALFLYFPPNGIISAEWHYLYYLVYIWIYPDDMFLSWKQKFKHKGNYYPIILSELSINWQKLKIKSGGRLTLLERGGREVFGEVGVMLKCEIW